VKEDVKKWKDSLQKKNLPDGLGSALGAATIHPPVPES
jgi:hypothetical protein